MPLENGKLAPHSDIAAKSLIGILGDLGKSGECDWKF